MGAIKRYLEEKQPEWAVAQFIKDGCPPNEAEQYGYDDAVEHLFDGDYDAAWDSFINSPEAELPDASR